MLFRSEGRIPYRFFQLESDPFEGSGAQLEIAVVNLRVERIPELCDEIVQKFESSGDA